MISQSHTIDHDAHIRRSVDMMMRLRRAQRPWYTRFWRYLMTPITP